MRRVFIIDDHRDTAESTAEKIVRQCKVPRTEVRTFVSVDQDGVVRNVDAICNEMDFAIEGEDGFIAVVDLVPGKKYNNKSHPLYFYGYHIMCTIAKRLGARSLAEVISRDVIKFIFWTNYDLSDADLVNLHSAVPLGTEVVPFSVGGAVTTPR